MRRTSVSLPTNKIASDPHEKPARYGSHHRQVGVLGRITGWMAQAKQARWLKTIAICMTFVFLFYYFSPTGVDLYNGGKRGIPDVAIGTGAGTLTGLCSSINKR